MKPAGSDLHPDFSPYKYKGTAGRAEVRVKLTGNRAADAAAANLEAGFTQTPQGFTWHHHEEVGTMMLIDTETHDMFAHTGGFAIWKRFSSCEEQNCMERTEITKHGVTLTLDKPVADEARVSAFEGTLGHPLPDGYRDFMLRYNGGRPTPSSFQLALRSGPYTDSLVDWFLSLHDGELSNLERTVKLMSGRFPPDTLPIGRDPFGNFVLIGLRGDTRGKVYFWDHENEAEDGPDWSNVDLVAGSFDGFMSGLKPSP